MYALMTMVALAVVIVNLPYADLRTMVQRALIAVPQASSLGTAGAADR
jgi:hypothetical protein